MNITMNITKAQYVSETPMPNAPPSDLCNKITIISIIAKAMLTKMSKLSMRIIYSNFLLYQ